MPSRTGSCRPAATDAAATVVGPSLAVVGGTGSGPRARRARSAASSCRVARSARRSPSAQAFALGGIALRSSAASKASKPSPTTLLRVNLATGRIVPSGTFEEPLAEAGVAADGGSAYLVGGWTGDQYATAVLKFTPPSTVSLVSRLPERRPLAGGRPLVGHTLYVAGRPGPSRALDRRLRRRLDSGDVTSLGQLPQPVEGGVLLAVGSKLYLLGGPDAGGKASEAVDPDRPCDGQPTPAGRMPTAARRGSRGPRRDEGARRRPDRRDDLPGLSAELAGSAYTCWFAVYMQSSLLQTHCRLGTARGVAVARRPRDRHLAELERRGALRARRLRIGHHYLSPEVEVDTVSTPTKSPDLRGFSMELRD